MRILADLYKDYKDIIDKYNQILDKQLDWKTIIDEALENLFTNSATDWSYLRHYRYYPSKYNKKPWEPVYYKPDYQKFKPYMKGNITADDIINFALKFNKPNLVKYRKTIIDATWNVDMLLAVLDKYQMTHNLQYGEDYIIIDCPACEHEGMKIWLNEDGSTIVSCFSTNCELNKTNIWKLFEVNDDTLFTAVETVWNIVNNMDMSKVEKIRRLEGVKVRKAYDNKNIEKIIADCTTDNKYMNDCGFSNQILEECDILFRDEKENWSCSESNDFRNRVCYIIKDVTGKIVGIQGRSVIDTDWERTRYVLEDSFWKTYYWSGKWNKNTIRKKNKLTKKVINTAGFDKSAHLYLLYKYIDNAESISKVVIVEGLKDAVRVYQQKLDSVAVVSIMGAEISNKQVELIKTVFGTEKHIILALDNDEPGFAASIKAYETLKNAGFGNISFVLYPLRNEVFYYKDFGDINKGAKTYSLIKSIIDNPVDIDTYTKAMKKVIPIAKAEKSIRNKLEKQKYWETIKDDFVISNEEPPSFLKPHYETEQRLKKWLKSMEPLIYNNQ